MSTRRNPVPVHIAGAVGKTSTARMLDAILAAETQDIAPTAIILSAGPAADGRTWRDVLEHVGSGVAIVSADDAEIRAAVTSASTVTFGYAQDADVRLDTIDTALDGTRCDIVVAEETYTVNVPLIGEHAAANLCAAVATALAHGIEVPRAIRALESLTSVGEWTMMPTRAPNGAVIINDAVSANWASTAAALKTLAQITPSSSRSIAVLGAIDCEAHTLADIHDRIGRLVVRLNIGQLLVVGDDARHIHAAAGLEGSWDGESKLFEDSVAVYDFLNEDLRSDDIVLVKSAARVGLGHLADRLSSAEPEALI